MSSSRVGRVILGTLVILACARPSFAQTSWGIAVTAANDVVFCDIRRDRVMRLSRAGDLTVLLSDTHCRTLVLGIDGGVYGESVSGGTHIDVSAGMARDNVLGIWRASGGATSWVQVPVPAPDPALWVVIDRQGRSYGWNGMLSKTTLSQIVRREGVGNVAVAGNAWGQRDGRGADAQLGRIAGMALAPDGTLVVADSGNIRRMTPDGVVRTESAGTITDSGSGVIGRYGLWDREMGVATDFDGAAVVVDYPARRIVRVGRDGRAQELWRSRGPWRPTGVAMAGDGFFVLEDWALPPILADLVGSPRVLYVKRADGSSHTVARVSSLMFRTLGGLALVMILSALHSWRRTRRYNNGHVHAH